MSKLFQINAYIHTTDDVLNINIKSFGVFKGIDELSENSPVAEGGITALRTKFEKTKTPAPMTFSWRPKTAREKNLFRKVGDNEIIIELTTSLRGDTNKHLGKFDFYFGGVKLIKKPYPYQGNERIDATYAKFFPHF